MSSRYTNLFRFSFVCADLVALNLVHTMLLLIFRNIPGAGDSTYGLLFLVGNMAWLVSAYSVRLYIENARPDLYRFAKRTAKGFVIFTIAVLMFIFIYHSYSRLLIFAGFSCFFIYLLFSRLALVGVSYFMQGPYSVARRIVIVGYNEAAKRFVERFSVIRKDFQVDGYFEDRQKITELSSLPIIGNIDECLDYAVNANIREIYSTIPPEQNAAIYDMAKQAEKSLIRFKFIPDFSLYVNRNTYVEYLDDFPILSLRPEPLEDMGNRVKKRVFDVAFSVLVMVLLLSWLIPILALLIKLTSRGPVFFKQIRSGKNNKQFTCYKLRTMTVNTDANIRQVTFNDTRITKLGRILRKTNVDELPQFVNVLLGSMSVVGPRPHMLIHTHKYSKIMGEYMIRHFLKPGITGWAQVNGYRGEIKDDEQLRKRIDHDLWYMENWSLWLDVKVVGLTVYGTLKGDKNAY